MGFVATPLVPGDLFDAAAKLSEAADAALFRSFDPAARLPIMAAQWQEIAELGWPALLVPEAQGGVDGSISDLVAVMEGAGRAGLCLPLAGICGVVPALLRRVGADDLLSRIATGDAVVVPALSPAAPWTRRADAARIEGVETLPDATHYLVALPGPRLVLVGAAGLAVTRHERLDGRASVDLHLQGVQGETIAEGPALQAALDAALNLGALLVAAEVTAAMGRAIELTIGYLNTRVQFGQHLGGFQALRHKVVEMFLGYEMLRSLVGHAVQIADASGEVPWRETALAKLRVKDVGRHIATTTIQLHGGMGMTQELAASRLAKRMLMAEFDYGDSGWQAQRLLEAGA